MKRSLAIEARSRALSAVKLLNSIVQLESNWSPDNMRRLKKGVGIAIGTIEVDLLSVIYKEFPDLVDLKDTQ